MRATFPRSIPVLCALMLLTVLVTVPLQGSGPGTGTSTVLVPSGAFPGGVLTGVVIGPDDKPVPNTPVNIAGGVPITLTGVVIGEAPTRPKPPQPCQPDANGNLPPGCPPERPKPPQPAPCQPDASGNLPPGCAPPTVSQPSDCAAILKQFAGSLAAAQPGTAAPTPAAGATPTAVEAAGGPHVLTDANGRFALCVPVDTPKVGVALPDTTPQNVPAIHDAKQGGALSQPPSFFPANDKVSLVGLLRQPTLEQGGRSWELPAVQAISADGQQALTTFKTPSDLQPGPVKLSFLDRSGNRQQFSGGAFRMLSASIDRAQLFSHEGADFEYKVQFGDGSVRACVQVSVTGPVVLTQAPPREIPLDASGIGIIRGKIRATQVAPGSTVPFAITPDIHSCGPGPQGAQPQAAPDADATTTAAMKLEPGPALVNPWGAQEQGGGIPAQAPAPTAIEPPSPNVSAGPSQTMGHPEGAAAHVTAPPPIYMCNPKLTTPAIGNVTNSKVPPGVFTQEPGRNLSDIHGCNFGDQPGHVYLIFPPASGQPGFGTPVELYLTSPWRSDLLSVVFDQSFGGRLDTDGVILQVVTAQGVKTELPNRKFRAWRVPLTIEWMPRSQVTLGSAGSNWITAVFKTVAPSQTQGLIIVEPFRSTEPVTATVSRSVKASGPFTVQDDLWDFSQLQPGFIVRYATPYYDSFDGGGCDQTSGHWGSRWDSATLLRVHVQGCYFKTAEGGFSSAFYGLTVVLSGPKGALPWPPNLQ